MTAPADPTVEPHPRRSRVPVLVLSAVVVVAIAALVAAFLYQRAAADAKNDAAALDVQRREDMTKASQLSKDIAAANASTRTSRAELRSLRRDAAEAIGPARQMDAQRAVALDAHRQAAMIIHGMVGELEGGSVGAYNAHISQHRAQTDRATSAVDAFIVAWKQVRVAVKDYL
jgi:hypothetical protein